MLVVPLVVPLDVLFEVAVAPLLVAVAPLLVVPFDAVPLEADDVPFEVLVVSLLLVVFGELLLPSLPQATNDVARPRRAKMRRALTILGI